MKADVRLQTFRCTRLHTTLSRESCAARYTTYAGRSHEQREKGVVACSCRTCPIGEMHARGKAPDVALAHVVAHVEQLRKQPRRCLVCGQPVGSGAPNARGRARNRFVCGEPSCRAAASEHADADDVIEWA